MRLAGKRRALGLGILVLSMLACVVSGLSPVWIPNCGPTHLSDQEKEELRAMAQPPYQGRSLEEQEEFDQKLDRTLPCGVNNRSAEDKFTAARLRLAVLEEIGSPLRFLIFRFELVNPDGAGKDGELYRFKGYSFFSLTAFKAEAAPAGGYMAIDGPF